MKFTVSWLKEHLETNATCQEISDCLTSIGLEVEEIDNPAQKYEGFVLGYVEAARPHPDADTLKVCTVDDGGAQKRQIICGAPNARAGIKVVVARPGALMPVRDEEGKAIEIKVSKIRGIQSQGMICSEREMGLGEDHDGIIELPQDVSIGQDFIAYRRDLDDPVIEINVTPNRGDALGVRGIARDLAAAGLGSLKPQRSAFKGQGVGVPALKVRIETPHCPAFAYRIIRGVKNRKAPQWMQKKLEAIGLRPISALVDVTNWMSYDNARPMHVFDFARLQGDLTVRGAREGECLAALNEREYTFDAQMTVIADEKGVVSLGGIMGGEGTGCTEDTQDVILEAALWDPVNIARTGRKLQIHSDARYRFERGVDPKTTLEHMNIATQYILDICGGEASELQLVGKIPDVQRSIAFDYGFVKRFGGVDLPIAQGIAYLEKLGFAVEQGKGDQLHVTVPSARPDIDRQWDFVEEILRLHGYDTIPAVSLPRLTAYPEPALTMIQQRRARAKRALAASGMSETVTWSFTASEFTPLFGGGNAELRLENPIIAELDEMRPSGLINLVLAAKRNLNRTQRNLALFEEGAIFTGIAPKDQRAVIAGLRTGESGERHWAEPQRAWDAFDAKADAERALAAAGAQTENLQVLSPAPSWYHPGRSGMLCLGPKNVLAHFGELHPKVLRSMGFKERAVGFEVFLEAIPTARSRGAARARFSPSPFNPLERDFAFLVEEDTPAKTVLKLAQAADRLLIKAVRLFDVYQGEGVPEGKKSLAITVVLQPGEASFTDAQLDALSDKIIASVCKSTGAELRG